MKVGDIRDKLWEKNPEMSQKFQEASNCLKELMSHKNSDQ